MKDVNGYGKNGGHDVMGKAQIVALNVCEHAPRVLGAVGPPRRRLSPRRTRRSLLTTLITNGEINYKGCRIMVGWNSGVIKVWPISMNNQNVFLLVESIQTSIKFYCSAVYASNSGNEREVMENFDSSSTNCQTYALGDYGGL
ncbi:hypothetical protein CTI12_AA540290 [Artemisia annua]|uniref:Uncharacterized protein n=1 Tax=Artemisia annua TaxID=35608 RepID=A0A2U1L1R6_ARTAN|nr:hypothetical protein CTI12_AA540290 [Artemisia annua]